MKMNSTCIRHDTDAGDAPLGQTLRRELDKVNAQPGSILPNSLWRQR